MSTPAIIMWLAVIAAGGVSAFRNPAAAALVLAWMACMAVSANTGEAMPLWFYFRADLGVIAIIMCKREQTLADRTVLLLYPVCWLFYISGIHPYHLFYALWAITLTQFLAVGWETFPSVRRFAEAASDALVPSPDDVFRRLAWVRGYG